MIEPAPLICDKNCHGDRSHGRVSRTISSISFTTTKKAQALHVPCSIHPIERLRDLNALREHIAREIGIWTQVSRMIALLL
ncbi:hypothetical protein DPMN_006569 [Dreissena polymorpha]|uniref:Uncharacterized protein n=1 Tax=Dreissena polymorpha TaxID=45954 RepID=A0A9D4MVF4_DREPO|nr:hypothetical protein DPMN_006569 [Dreissena polymorpha]